MSPTAYLPRHRRMTRVAVSLSLRRVLLGLEVPLLELTLLSSSVTASSATSPAVFLSKTAPSSTPSAPGVCSLALLLPGVAFGIPVHVG